LRQKNDAFAINWMLKHAVSRLKSSKTLEDIDMDVPPKVNIGGHAPPPTHRDQRHYPEYRGAASTRLYTVLFATELYVCHAFVCFYRTFLLYTFIYFSF